MPCTRRPTAPPPTATAGRMAYERATAHAILDEAYHCHLGFVVDGEPRVLPTLHVRVGDTLYLHGSTGSRPLLAARGGRACRSASPSPCSTGWSTPARSSTTAPTTARSSRTAPPGWSPTTARSGRVADRAGREGRPRAGPRRRRPPTAQGAGRDRGAGAAAARGLGQGPHRRRRRRRARTSRCRTGPGVVPLRLTPGLPRARRRRHRAGARLPAPAALAVADRRRRCAASHVILEPLDMSHVDESVRRHRRRRGLAAPGSAPAARPRRDGRDRRRRAARRPPRRAGAVGPALRAHRRGDRHDVVLRGRRGDPLARDRLHRSSAGPGGVPASTPRPSCCC